MDIDEFGKLQLELVGYSWPAVSTPKFVSVSVPNYMFNKIAESPRKFSKFKTLIEHIQTPLFESVVENRMYPRLSEEKRVSIEAEAKELVDGLLPGYLIESGKQYLVFILDVNKNIKFTKKLTPELKEGELKIGLYNFHTNYISEIIETKINSIETKFDPIAYV